MADPFAIVKPAGVDDAVMGALIDDVEQQFAMMFVNARNSIRARAAAIDPELPPLGFKVLTVLSRSGPRQQGCLAEDMEVDKAMMSRTIKQLEVLGLVVRSIDPRDGRALLVAMTDEARERFNANLADARRVLHDKLAEWEPGEVRRFTGLLAKLNESAL
ncbi:MarR family winged helix-turn-helix transcriptional regulator [Paeniglutamicibacter gangotriensis]|uniref:MarR family transcriptional regulator n=2 Tax=Paeniglutamicibacter gangotriensis TaxID=254787 RepID=M7NER1_9MICC|nr:MarR family transcriptional regulator [Paeniglutamicibacter gangotriensis]EMR00270.1 MarR family transcriptional regulator [Paeniglutamicibacter gangotriensis Lz1y]KAA0979320.1 MarR family transcriptional regulator [Paeniglutamicibacter gangotriensis]